MKRLAGLAIAAVAGCGAPDALPPRGQVLLFIDTDAVLPDDSAIAPDVATVPMPLFDRMTVEVFAPGATDVCAGCRREFVLDRATFERVEASVGIVPETTEAGYRARVRMFRASTVRDGAPPPRTVVEATVALPPVEAEGIVESTVVLRVDGLGAPNGDLDHPVAVAAGRPSASLVGTWPPAQRVPCAGAPLPGEVCVPGGAYWMGETQVIGAEVDGDEERLVVLSPFFLDATEVTVGAFRESGLDVTAWSGSLSGDDPLGAFEDWCTYTDAPSERDARAVNCVDWESARAYCLMQGKDLPTEAQWEYAARALSGRRYVWGTEPADCDDAVWGHGMGANFLPPACPAPNVIGGPLEPGSGQRDRLDLPTGTIVDLAGNVREWMRDVFNGQDEACWTAAPISFDPLCATIGMQGEDARSTRGDGFFQPGIVASAAARSAASSFLVGVFYGFRCSRASP